MNITVTLRYQGKEYTFVDEFDYAPWYHSDGTIGRTAFEAAEYLYTEGNYCCDCNRSQFLVNHCGVSFEGQENSEEEDGEWRLQCGKTIELVSLNGIRYFNNEPVSDHEYAQCQSGLYVPVGGNQ